MSDVQIHPSHAKFGVAFLRSITAWNNAENSARDILNSLSKGGIGATIAIHQLGNTSLVDALKTVCQFLGTVDNPLAKEQADHILHFIDGLDRLRVYRNHYVHQIRSVVLDDYGECSGNLWGLEVKNGYSFINDQLSLTELERFTGHAIELEDYGNALAANFGSTELTRAAGIVLKPLTLLRKPLWPDRLKKSRESLLTPPVPR